MILDALPRNLVKPFEMAPDTLRWEINRSQLPEALSKIESAFRENVFVKDFAVEQGQVSSNLLFVQVVYSRVDEQAV